MGALFLHLSVPISCSIRRSTAHTPIMHPHSPLRAAVRQITMHRSPIIGPETTEPQLRFDTRSEYVGPFDSIVIHPFGTLIVRQPFIIMQDTREFTFRP
jgi:hypothetical protein